MMLVTQNSLDYFAKLEAGGKGYNLYLMQQQNFPIPDWIVLGQSVWHEFEQHNDIKKQLDSALDLFQQNKLSVTELAKQAHDLIIQAPMPAKVEHIITQAYQQLGDKPLISVRSSASDEDSAVLSFAGQLSSYLYVQGITDVLSFVKTCWASAYNENCLVYRQQNQLPLSAISVAVVLQQMIEPDVSGVLFTADPTGMNQQQIIINAVYGVGEGLVSDHLQGDSYWLDSKTGKTLSIDIVEKAQALRRGNSGHCQTYPVDNSKQNAAALNPSQLDQLWKVALQIEQFYGIPQDIEWALVKDQLYILQARPITTIEQAQYGFSNLWDNANIVESYGGITLPLSFTFALANYHGVYTQFCEILGVSPRIVREMDYYLANMLGSINGRVYYNLYNWYKLIGVLPGFSQNKQFMETMMGVGETLPDDIEQRIEPHPSWQGFQGKLKRLRTGVSFLIYHFTIQKHVDQFLLEFDNNFQHYRHKAYASMTSDQLFSEYLTFNQTFLGQWKAPIINDFLCMIHFGVFNKLTQAWLSQNDQNLQNDLLAGEGGLESAEPTKFLINLAKGIVAQPELKKFIEAHDNFELLEALNQSEFQAFYVQVTQYIDLYGYRGTSEMKLEVKDLSSDPSFLFACIKNYLRSGITDVNQFEKNEHQLRHQAEQKIFSQTSGWRQKIYLWSLKHARKALKNRENTRFARTRAYGVARNIFNHMGDRLAQLNILKAPEDIFYLTLQEIYGLHQGTLTTQNLLATVTQRQLEYTEYESQEPKIRFLTRGPVYWRNQIIDQPEAAIIPQDMDCDLIGLGCCPGIVEATVRILHSPDDDVNLDNQILVTQRTDPGWVPIFPNVSGILVERGSLLSHSAIVAREMGIPAVVGIKSLLHTLKDGMKVRMDGRAGTIHIL